MKTMFAGGCLVLLLAAAGTAGGDGAKDLKALQGSWDGVASKGDKMHGFTLTIMGDKWHLKMKDKAEFNFKGSLTLDPKASPKTMDMKVEGGEGKGVEMFMGKTALTIYELSGDTLKWCANEPGREDRPKEFSPDGPHLYIQFKRVK